VTCSCTAVVPEAGVTGLFIPHYWMPRLLDLDEVSLVACALWLTALLDGIAGRLEPWTTQYSLLDEVALVAWCLGH
jgi:hypothetical protein